MNFKDHFSKRAVSYAQYRPGYPATLFQYLASRCSERKNAWDCATGNGQAAGGLAKLFQHVIATDPSKKQIANAVKYPKVDYCIALAQKTPIQSGTMNLVTIAQALHWLDIPKFFKEVKRVLKPGGYVAVWCYNLLHVHPRVDILLYRYYTEIVGPYWPPERKLTEEGYSTVSFPFEEEEVPTFEMDAEWNVDDLIGYLRTWSSSQSFLEKNGRDPVLEIEKDLREAWGPAQKKRKIRWPLSVRLGSLSV